MIPWPWQERSGAYASGDFSAPDVPQQSTFEGSRRQKRGRVVGAFREHGELDELGPRVRVDYTPDGDAGTEWLRELLADLEADGLVDAEERGETVVARLAR